MESGHPLTPDIDRKRAFAKPVFPEQADVRIASPGR